MTTGGRSPLISHFYSILSLTAFIIQYMAAGPLGQGIANGVGLAVAEKHLAARFNKPDAEIVDHYTSVHT